MAQNLNAPVLAGVVEGEPHFCIQTVALDECAVKVQVSDLRAHAGLSHEGNSFNWVFDLVSRLVRVCHFVIQNTVNRNFDIVLSNRVLTRNFEDFFF